MTHVARLLLATFCLIAACECADAQVLREGPPAMPAPRLPQVDESALSADSRAAWHEVRTRFLFTSAHVADAHERLSALSSRLHSRGLALNVDIAARAASMQAFLDDSVALIGALNFEQAGQALVRAAYQRERLTDVIGR